MPDLSACYFCGTALDEPLSEYPVVPKTLQPTADQQRTVVLCDGCRRKLGRVLDTVLEAVEERPVDASVQQDLGGKHEAVVDEAADLLEDESAASADAEGGQQRADAAEEDQDEDDSEDDAKSDVSAAASATSGWSTVNVKHSNARRRSSSNDVDGEDEADDASDAGGSGGAAAGDAEDATADETASASDAGDAGATAGDDGATTGDAGDADEADGAGVTEGQTLSRLEYSKVMRLLENREFPVDRAEIRTVATNAYEIRPEEFDAIVDAAVKRGLLVEENGKFVEME